MKYFATLTLLFLTFLVRGQNYPSLLQVSSEEKPLAGRAIIYGNFIQRLGFSSGGFPQDIRLMNLDTKHIVSFRVKAAMKSAKENTFVYYIEPGRYAILNYWWTQSKWYGGKTFTEPIYKNVDVTDGFVEKINSGLIKTDTLQHFTFTLPDKGMYYMGTWHFDRGLVTFNDDKETFDQLLQKEYRQLDCTKAVTVLPE